uniref:Uncharacterized protein n=1 Tax=Medicago truncatula TaxID=3880 RepID=I3SR10_MEDTR|nr:unknown [Medicago truncatula]
MLKRIQLKTTQNPEDFIVSFNFADFSEEIFEK